MDAEQEAAVRVARARAVQQTTLTPGWSVIRGIAASIQREFELAALECDNDAQVIRLQHKAQAVKEFTNRWMNEIERASNPDAPTSVDDFVTITTD